MLAKITAVLGLLLMVGCASVQSEYSQGCEDGVTSFVEEGLHSKVTNEKALRKQCDALDDVHQNAKKLRGKAAQ